MRSLGGLEVIQKGLSGTHSLRWPIITSKFGQDKAVGFVIRPRPTSSVRCVLSPQSAAMRAPASWESWNPPIFAYKC